MVRYRTDRAGKIKYLFGLLILISFTACCINDPCSVHRTDFWASESFHYEVDAEDQTCFRIHGVNGSIEIIGAPDQTMVEIWGDRIVKSESISDAEIHLKKLEVSVSSNQNEVYVRTIQPKKTYGRDYEVEYHVRIPGRWQAVIENVNGEVIVHSVTNDVSVALINGDTHLDEIFGNIWVDVINGCISSKSILPYQGICQMSTVNGQIDLKIPEDTSARFCANVTNGNINISNLIFNNLNTTRNSATGTLAEGHGSIKLTLVNGQINVKGF